MSRFPFLLLVALLLAPAAGSAPKLKDRPAASYYPTTVGDRWVTETKFQTGTVETIEVVTAVETKDGATVVTVGLEVDGKVGPAVSRMKVTDKGLFRMSHMGTAYTEPYCVLQLPLKPGVGWTAEANRGGTTPTTFKYKAVNEEDVEVPAGKFRAFRIDVEIGSMGKARIWYAPRVGVIRQEQGEPDSGSVKVLKSFKPGK